MTFNRMREDSINGELCLKIFTIFRKVETFNLGTAHRDRVEEEEGRCKEGGRKDTAYGIIRTSPESNVFHVRL